VAYLTDEGEILIARSYWYAIGKNYQSHVLVTIVLVSQAQLDVALAPQGTDPLVVLFLCECFLIMCFIKEKLSRTDL